MPCPPHEQRCAQTGEAAGIGTATPCRRFAGDVVLVGEVGGEPEDRGGGVVAERGDVDDFAHEPEGGVRGPGGGALGAGLVGAAVELAKVAADPHQAGYVRVGRRAALGP
jgi:hypothetical protein